jgi:NADH-quinone oxidoreductase subunit M
LIWVLLLPALATVAAPFLKKREAMVLSFLAFFIPFLVSFYWLFTGYTLEVAIQDVVGPIGRIYIYGDSLSHAFGFTIALISAMVAVYSLPYMEHRFHEMGLDVGKEFRKYWLFYNLYAASMLWLVYAGNFILLYVFLEISLIASFLLIYMYGYGNRQWVALLYFVWTNVAGVLALIGFILIGMQNGTMAMDAIKAVGMTAWLLVFVGMLIKLPGFGPHIWLPWAHAEAPTPVSALLSPLTVGLAGYVILRVYFIDSSFIESYRIPILAYGIFTSIYAGLSVFRQKDFKRLLAYSTVSQMGYMLIGFAAGTFGVLGVVIQYISHAFGKSILFMSAGAIIAVYHGLRDVEKMGGMHEYVPTISNAALLGFMTLSGILTVGMFGEFFILKGIADIYGLSLTAILPVIVVFIISGLYSFYTMKNIFYGKPKGYETPIVSRLLDTPLYVIGIISVLLILPPLATLFLAGVKIAFGGVLP